MGIQYRRRVAEWLRNLADRVDRESAYCMFPGHFNFVRGEGLKVTLTEGIPIQPAPPGSPLFLKSDLYDRAWIGYEERVS